MRGWHPDCYSVRPMSPELDPVRVTATWRVAPAEARATSAALHVLMMATRLEPGCERCVFSTDMADDVVVRYVEDWSSESELQRHIQSDRFAQLAELLEHATDAPAVEFSLPTGRRGLEYAERVRAVGQL